MILQMDVCVTERVCTAARDRVAGAMLWILLAELGVIATLNQTLPPVYLSFAQPRLAPDGDTRIPNCRM